MGFQAGCACPILASRFNANGKKDYPLYWLGIAGFDWDINGNGNLYWASAAGHFKNISAFQAT